jgi:molybdenum cofactor guanylyltransferase
LLRRTCGVLQRAGLRQVVVVRAPGQDLPPLPADVEVVDDPRVVAVEALGGYSTAETGRRIR